MNQDNQNETVPEGQGTLFEPAEWQTYNSDVDACPEPAAEAGEAFCASEWMRLHEEQHPEPSWHGWPPQVWDGEKWIPIEPAKLLVEQEKELRRLRAARAVGVAFMVAGDRASLIPVNPIACERLRKLTPGTTIVVEIK
jgi:hypothetical protein